MNKIIKYWSLIKGLILVGSIMSVLSFYFGLYDTYGDDSVFAAGAGTILIVFLWRRLSKKFNL